MADNSDGVVIIGAGHGGAQLAASLREEGWTGPVTLISADPEAPYHKPPLSKSFMKTADAPLQPLRGERFYADKGVDLRLGVAATRIDRAARVVACSDGRALRYAHLVLATGARARGLSAPGADLPGVFRLRDAADARAMRAALPPTDRAVIIGGGFIGLEAAAMLAGRGLSATVVELAPRLLGRAVSAETAEAVAESLRAQGVGLRCGVGVEALTGAGRVEAVRLAGGEALPADLVVIGVGAAPDTALAEAAGLACDNGVLVDAQLATADPHIHAIGDCAAYPQAQLGRVARLESVQNAADQARTLAKTLAGTPTAYAALPWFWSDIGPLKLQIAGVSDAIDDAIAARRADGSLQSLWRLSGGRLVAVETLNSPGEHMLARRLIAEGLTPPAEAMASGDLAALKAAYAAARRG